MFYSANPDPNLFESLTMDEVLLVIQGFVDRQRIERRNAYLIHASMVEHAVDMFECLPLPYDDELQQMPMADKGDADFYKQTVDSGYLNSQWWNN